MGREKEAAHGVPGPGRVRGDGGGWSARVVVAWLGLVPLMIGNGILRASVYGPAFSELQAHQLSTVAGMGIVLAYAVIVLPWMEIRDPASAWRAGLAWLVLTVAFEFGFGHWVAGHPWSRLVADYDLSRGRIWSLLLGATAAAPRVALALRRRDRA